MPVNNNERLGVLSHKPNTEVPTRIKPVKVNKSNRIKVDSAVGRVLAATKRAEAEVDAGNGVNLDGEDVGLFAKLSRDLLARR